MKGGMTLTQFSNEPDKIEQIGSTVYLRKNIEKVEEKVDGETLEYWQADEEKININEVDFDVNINEVDFDDYFEWAKERREREEEKRIAENKYQDLVKLLKEQKEQDDTIDDALELIFEQEGLI